MERIVVIRLESLGDVIRTTPLAEAIKKAHPEAQLLWVTRKESVPLLEGQTYIDEVKSIPFKTDETFHILYNFDTDKEAMELAGQIKAENKCGFFFADGHPAAFNAGAEYYLKTLVDKEAGKTNRKTYQEMMFETAELSYDQEKCLINLTSKDRLYAETFAQRNKIRTEKLIGIHIGAALRSPSKAWHSDCIISFTELARKKGYEIILFAGPNEEQRLSEILAALTMKRIKVFCNAPSNTTREFASLVNICRYIVCPDSFCLYLALALKKKTAGLFFCSNPDEVEGYGLLKKMISPRLQEFLNIRTDFYDAALTRSIVPADVLDALESL